MRKINLKEGVNVIILVLVLIFTTKFFQSTPFESLFFQIQAVFLGLILLFLVVYVFSTLIKKGLFNKVILYFLLISIIIPIYSAYRAKLEFGQPFIFGVLSERVWILLGVGVWIYYKLVTKKLSFKSIELAFLFMAWVSLIFFTFVYLTFDPTQLEYSKELSKFAHITPERGLRLKFQIYFIAFGTIYYFIKYNVRRKIIDLFLFFMFLAFAFFIIKGRTYMMFMGIVILLYYWLNYSLPKFTFNLFKLLTFIFILLMISYIVMPEYIERMVYLFKQMFIVLAGKMSEDPSANARIFESLIVFNYFNNHPFSIVFGTGKVSNHWKDGYESLFGYFYPSDIGILGGVFLYGIVGFLFLFLVPVVISMKVIKKISNNTCIFILTMKYFLIFYLIKSIQGDFYFNCYSYMLPLFILLSYIRIKKRDKI